MTGPSRRIAVALAAVIVLLSACSSTPPSTSPSAAAPTAAAASAAASMGPGSSTAEAPSAPAGFGATRAPGTPTPTDALPSEPAATPPSGVGAAPPKCSYQDKPVAGNPSTDWATVVLDTIYRLPATFVPRKLVSTSKAGMQSGFKVISEVIDDLRAMHQASAQAGAEIAIRSAYRSYAEQQSTFGYWVRQSGQAAALLKSARPGHSEHQLGTAIDFRSADSPEAPWDYPDWATTAPGAWMGQNAWKFGFILSYPKGMTAETCYAYEPWHYRYVGRALAKQVHDSGETLRAFLWGLAHPAN